MPSKSPAQARLMAAAAHTPGGYGGVPQSVGRDFNQADKGTGMIRKRADGGKVTDASADDFPDADAPIRPISDHPAIRAAMDTARAEYLAQPKASQSEDERRAAGHRLMSIGIRG